MRVVTVISSIVLGYVLFSILGLPVHASSGAELTGQILRSTVLAANPTSVLGAGIAFGLAALGAGVAVGYAGSAAIAAIAEKPNLFGRALVIVVLGEGIAIYGFVIVFILTSL
ncbi:MAG: ATP synthase subunit C [Thaumarchaeota archaeon]|nr:ATP synthase subunit C [Nitrososphaerota archaeon]